MTQFIFLIFSGGDASGNQVALYRSSTNVDFGVIFVLKSWQ